MSRVVWEGAVDLGGAVARARVAIEHDGRIVALILAGGGAIEPSPEDEARIKDECLRVAMRRCGWARDIACATGQGIPRGSISIEHAYESLRKAVLDGPPGSAS